MSEQLKCIKCRKRIWRDEGYKTIARCKNKDCEKYNVPISCLPR